MQAIADWLKNGTYDEGVRLYEHHGQSAFFKLKFKSGPNEYNVGKLRGELAKLAVNSGQLTEDNEVKGEHTQTAPPMTFAPAPELARKYLALINKKTKLYLQLNMLMEQKHHLAEGEELRKCAVGILNLNQQLTETWALIDYYQDNNTFPDEEPVKVKPEMEPKKEMQLLRQTISKAKKRLRSPTCRNREQTQNLLDTSNARLAVLVAAKPKRK